MSFVVSVEAVIEAHDEILANKGGLQGFAQSGKGGLESALQRVENHMRYAQINDVFEIAALYASSTS